MRGAPHSPRLGGDIRSEEDRVAELFDALFARGGLDRDHQPRRQHAAHALRGHGSSDAVLVSSRLHHMGGVEPITWIRALTHRHDLPIVIVTGTVDCAVLAGALAAGADDVLSKPVDVAISRRR